MNISHWSIDHFCTYILLCLASSDHDLDENEVQTIKNFLSQQDIKKPDTLIKELLIVIKYQTIEDRFQFIENKFSSFIQNSEDAEALVVVIEELIITDFTIAPNEMDLYRIIKKMIREMDL